MDIILWGIGNSLVIMGLLFASLNGINMGKDNILEGVQNASKNVPTVDIPKPIFKFVFSATIPFANL